MPLDAPNWQPSLPGFCQIEAAVAAVAASGVEARGAVFTRREVVEFILDLVGYTSDKPLHQARILEPAVGQGDFLVPTIERLFEAYANVPSSKRRGVVTDLADCLRAVELHHSSYDQTFEAVSLILRGKGLKRAEARALCARWLIANDFLLVPLEGEFTHVVG